MRQVQLGFPRAFGRYTLLRSFGRGAMGDAYLAAVGDAEAMRLCVVKTGLADDRPELGLAGRFANEARTVMNLACANIATVFDVGYVDGARYIAMEYVEGRDLDELMATTRMGNRALPLPIAALIAREVSRGLYYAYAESGLKVIHRDLAPANVLVSFSGDVKLIDFGLAHSSLRPDVTQPGVLLGHIEYLSPERLRGDPADHRGDVYSLGVILWELVTGETLFASRTHENARRASQIPAIPAPVTRRADVDLELSTIITRALAPAVADRFADAEAMRLALAKYLLRTAPGTDARTLADYVRDLVGAELVETQKKQSEAMLAEVAEIKRRPKQPADEGTLPTVSTGDLRVGTLVGGKYQIDRLCGAGGMGKVYEAHHVDIERRVAVKILKHEFRMDVELVERFGREAKLAAKADHENIVAMLDTGTTTDGVPFLVMEYLEGETLQQFLAREKVLPIDRSLQIAHRVARALERAHDAGVVHRDLKPGNVMLASVKGAQVIKVLDFGLSKGFGPEGRAAGGEITKPFEPIGSPWYMAPEQVRGQAADGRSDIFAVGGMLYEMVTGRMPWDGENSYEIIRLKTTTDPAAPAELRSDVSPLLNRVIMEALSRDPDTRQQTIAELRHDIEACLDEIESASRSAVSRIKRRRLGALAVGATAAILIGGLGLRQLAAQRKRGEVARSEPTRAVASPVESIPAASPPAPAPVAPAVPPPTPTIAAELAPAASSAVDPDVPPATTTRRPRPQRTVRASVSRSESIRPAIADASNEKRPEVNDILARARRSLTERRYDDALELARQAVALGGGLPSAHVVLGDALTSLGRDDPAKTEYEKALALDPGNAQAKSRLKIISAKRED